MRILILSGTFKENADGVARTLHKLSASLSRASIDHWVYAPMVDEVKLPHLSVRYVRSIAAPWYPDYRISFPPRRLQEEWAALRPDIVHIATPDLLGNLGIKFAKRHGLPLVGAYHTDFPSYASYYHLGALEPLVWWQLRRFYNACNAILAPTETMMRRLSEHGIGNAPEGSKLHLWSRGIDATLFHPGRRNHQLRKQWGGDDDFYVAFAGRLVWYKEVGLVRDVAKHLQSTAMSGNRRLRFVFIGDGPARDELQAALPTAIFTGHKSKEEVGEAMASADLLLFPSRTETFGQVVMESMACGLPALVSDQGGPAEIVRQSRSLDHGDVAAGAVLPAGDVQAFATAVERYFKDKEHYQRSAEAARQFTQQRDWHTVNQVVIDLYAKLLSI